MRDFLKSRGIELPEGDAGRRARRGDRQRPGHAQERPRPGGHRARRRRGLRGLGALPARPRATRACAARSCPPAPTAEAVLEAAGIDRPVRGARRRRRRRRASTCEASPRPTCSSPARRRSGVEAAQAAVFEDALAGVEAGRAGDVRLRRRRGPRRPAPTRCASTAPTSSSTTSPNCWSDEQAHSSRSTRGRCTRTSSTSTTARPGRVGLRAVQRPHRPARQPRRGRARRPARHLPQRLLRGRARCPTPRPATAIPRTARRSSTSPTASSSACWSTTSRSTSATASCSRTRATLDLRAGVLRREVQWRSPAGPRDPAALDAAGVASPSARSRPSTTRSSRVDEAGADRRAVRARRQRAAARARPTTRARRPRCAPRWWPRTHGHYDLTAVLVHRTRAAACAWPPAWTTWSTAPRARSTATESQRGPGARDGHDRARSRARRCACQAAGLRLVEPALAARRCATRSRPRSRGAAHRLGRSARRAARATSTTSGTGADVEIDGDRGLQPAVRFAHLPHAAGRRARRGARDPGQGPDRAAATTATCSGTPRPTCCPCSPTPRPTRPPTRCAGGTRRSTSRMARAEQLGFAGAAFPWRTIRGQECSGYWPAGTAAFHINADIAAAALRYVHATGDEQFDERHRPRRCSWRPRGCGARSATTTRRARSTSTA